MFLMFNQAGVKGATLDSKTVTFFRRRGELPNAQKLTRYGNMQKYSLIVMGEIQMSHSFHIHKMKHVLTPDLPF